MKRLIQVLETKMQKSVHTKQHKFNNSKRNKQIFELFFISNPMILEYILFLSESEASSKHCLSQNFASD